MQSLAELLGASFSAENVLRVTAGEDPAAGLFHVDEGAAGQDLSQDGYHAAAIASVDETRGEVTLLLAGGGGLSREVACAVVASDADTLLLRYQDAASGEARYLSLRSPADAGQGQYALATGIAAYAAPAPVWIVAGDSGEALTGGAGLDMLVGGAGDDILDGGAWSDVLLGGAGNDTYVVDSLLDQVVETAADGTDAGGEDTVEAGVSYTLSEFVETLMLTGERAIDGTGNALDNLIVGNGAANLLDGGAGADSLMGGAGDDTYVVDDAGDRVYETMGAGGGMDTVRAGVSFTLGSNIEALVLTGTAAIDGAGNALNNSLTGNAAANLLNGRAGADLMAGGAGDDIYVVDNAGDRVSETAADGTDAGGVDTVQSGVSFALGQHVESLVLTGTAAVNGTGNALDNSLTGNGAANLLDGGAGADVMAGGAGNDTYVVDNIGDRVGEATAAGLDAGGVDTVRSGLSYSLGAYVENLTLTGTAATDGTGNALNNTLTGNGAANLLDGGAGADTLLGGGGDDTYIVETAGDRVSETTAGGGDAGGRDTVRASVSFTLGAFVEILTLTGTAAIDATGNALDNMLNGNGAANILDGGAGADVMAGGAGDDTYVIDSLGDQVQEAAADGTDAGGYDTVRAGVSFTLGSHVENLTLTGTAAISGTGNSLRNRLTGNGAANVLDGGWGRDILDGGAGDDVLIGGAGEDVYIVDSLGDRVQETTTAGGDIDAGGYFDRVETGISYTLGRYVEDLTLTGAAAIDGTGNELSNRLTGNGAANILSGGDGNDTLDGGAGDDILLGGAGSDTYRVDSIGDQVCETTAPGSGIDAGGDYDQVESSVSWTLGDLIENLRLTGTAAINGTGNAKRNFMLGNGAANVLIGGAGGDGIDGRGGADIMLGGEGGDNYSVDDAGDVVCEATVLGGDIDAGGDDTVRATVSFTMGRFIEDLYLDGTGAIDGIGNELNNYIYGNAAANLIDGGGGNDILFGGGGADIMRGGSGDDTYRVDSEGVRTTEATAPGGGDAGGQDVVVSSASIAIGDYIEVLFLTGEEAIDGTGNAQDNSIMGNDAANVLGGGAGDDYLTGGMGDDLLFGGAGNDSYQVETAGDRVCEATSLTSGIDAGGIDIVRSGVSFTLGDFIENLTLNGWGNNGTGNALDNRLEGNAGANILDGGAGNDTIRGWGGGDTLTGGAGADVFVFYSNDVNARITDFSAAEGDRLRMNSGSFGGITGLTTGAEGNFVMGAGAQWATTQSQRFLFDTTTGSLRYDADGSGGYYASVTVATLTPNSGFSAASIVFA